MSYPRLNLTPGEREIYRSRPFVPPSEWAEQHVIVKDGPYAGSRWKNDTAPYLAGVMDTWADPLTEEVVVVGSPQTGKTSSMYRCLEWAVDYRPGPRMLAMPDDDTLDRVSQHKLLPALRATATTAAKLLKSTLDTFVFRDGSVLYLSSAQSPAQRASVSIRDLFLDEECLYKAIATQGDPVSDFLERTTSFSFMRKHFRVSKPVGGDDASIWQAMLDCAEVRVYAAACPQCGAEQFMRFGQVDFQGCKDPKKMRQHKLARYKCEHCGHLWTDQGRNEAVRRGGWRPAHIDREKRTATACEPVERPRSVGFHLPSLISPFVSLSDVAADFLACHHNPAKWQAFFNGRLAEPYVPAASKTSAETILDARVESLPPRTVPSAAVALTAGLDVQKRGVWYVVRAWAETLESWLVDYGFLGTLEEARQLLFETIYPVEVGGQKGIWRAGMDTGGSETDDGIWTRTEEIYQWIRAYGAGKVFACKGASHSQLQPVRRSPIDRLPKSGRLIPGGLVLHVIDSDHFKRLIHSRFMPDHTQPMHLHGGVQRDYADQVSAEELAVVKGKAVWRQVRRDNHLLDCEVLAGACAAAEWMPSLQLLARGMGERPTPEKRERREKTENRRRW